jgi:hypothetical protein
LATRVPGIVAGIDRICFLTRGEELQRCFLRPRRGEVSGRLTDAKLWKDGSPLRGGDWRKGFTKPRDAYRMAEGTRGLCYETLGAPTDVRAIRCIGDIPTPSPQVYMAAISPGKDAAACGIADGAVWCWGEGYSPPGDLARPVEIPIEPAATLPEVAMAFAASDASSSLPRDCLIHRGCATTLIPIRPCAPGLHPRDVADLLASAETNSGQEVSVRGPLGVGSATDAMTGAVNSCRSDMVGAPVVLGGATGTIGLPFLSCGGDSSALCCNVQAYGQLVVATGRLTPVSGRQSSSAPDPKWTLDGMSLCIEHE